MPYPVITTRAVILSTHPTGEANRILTLLTEHNGVLHVLARSIRLEKSRMRSSAIPYALVTTSVVVGRHHILKDLRVIDPLTDVWRSEALYTSYVSLLRFVRAIVPALGHEDPALFSLVLDAIQSYKARPPCQAGLVLLAAQVLMLRQLGYVHDPSLERVPFSTVVSRTVTSPKQQHRFKKHLKEGMAWQ